MRNVLCTVKRTLSFAEEVQELLRRIEALCRKYPTQRDIDRRLSFAGIRTAAETIGTLADDQLSASAAEQVRSHVQIIGDALDQLGDSFGSEEQGRCRVCGNTLEQTYLGGDQYMSWCTRCPSTILQAVADIEDLL